MDRCRDQGRQSPAARFRGSLPRLLDIGNILNDAGVGVAYTVVPRLCVKDPTVIGRQIGQRGAEVRCLFGERLLCESLACNGSVQIAGSLDPCVVLSKPARDLGYLLSNDSSGRRIGAVTKRVSSSTRRATLLSCFCLQA